MRTIRYDATSKIQSAPSLITTKQALIPACPSTPDIFAMNITPTLSSSATRAAHHHHHHQTWSSEVIL